MATTTNYGWTTPDDTALVKDGAAAIRTLGSSVDTTTKALNPSTTLGDIEYRSSTANTNTRLAIGTTGQILTVAGGVPSWATPAAGGGLTLISTTSLSGTSNALSSIPQTYKHLQLIIHNARVSSGSGNLSCYPNSSTGGGYGIGATTGTTAPDLGNGIYLASFANPLGVYTDNAWVVNFFNYSSTTARKPFDAWGAFVNSSNSYKTMFYRGIWDITAAISSINIDCGASLNGGTALLYGVN
jgi:hypothetical protein